MIAYPESLLWDLPRITAEYELLIEPYFPQYAFYENKGKKKCDYFCTRCHCWHCNEPFRLCHNEYFPCRHCGEEVKAKALHFGRNKLERSRKFGLCFAVDGDFYIRFVRLISVSAIIHTTKIPLKCHLNTHSATNIFMFTVNTQCRGLHTTLGKRDLSL